MTTTASRPLGVMGLGKSGCSAVAALQAQGRTVWAWDDGEPARQAAQAAGLTLTDLHTADLSALDLLVWSPGIPHILPRPHPVARHARAAGVPVVCDVELLLQRNPLAKVVAITGTNGKSTTTTLIAHLLRHAGLRVEVGGNLGIPALDLAPLGADGVYVLELSSYQLELLDQAQVDVGVLLNITPDHLARHGDMAGYAAVKAGLFARLRETGTAIIGVDDRYCAEIAANLPLAQRVRVSVCGQDAEIMVETQHLLDQRDQMRLDLSDLPRLPGQHNRQNIGMAVAACRALGVSPTDLTDGLRCYPGLAHRQEWIDTVDGVRHINDSKATNADATEKALVCYDTIYWILGGQAKEGGIESLTPLFSRIRRAFLIGEAAPAFAETLTAGQVAFESCGTLERAVPQAQAAALADGVADPVVLLSPACASWDQFRSFEHRGDCYRALVAALPRAAALASSDQGR